MQLGNRKTLGRSIKRMYIMANYYNLLEVIAF